ncbi:MAG: response regulator [Bacteroidales bacterium]|nr:response regulator [Bacteroidales bacterium]
MNLKNLKIGTQLRIGFAILLFFVILLGVVSYLQTDRIQSQAEILYDHPLKTRRNLSEITINVLNMRIKMRDYLLVNDSKIRQEALNDIAVCQANVMMSVEKLRQSYLGPPKNIDNFLDEFTKWVSIREESIRLLNAGHFEEARLRHYPGGVVPSQASKVLNTLQVISDFAIKKADELLATSNELNDSLSRRLFLLVATILLLSLLINYVLIRNIRKPIVSLTNAAQLFHAGDMNARSSYESKNEFGQLSTSFNTLAESIQVNMDLNKRAADLAGLMLSEDDAKNFFHETLKGLSEHTESQIAAAYLLSDDKKNYNHFESIGGGENIKQSFSAENFEGEFGAALSSRKIQHIKYVIDDTRFIFHTISGNFIPREIITIPIVANNQVIAIISLASVNRYSIQSILLIENILVAFSARVEGILAYRKIKEFTNKLEYQNSELEAQKVELASQSAELIEQNTELEMQKKQLGEANRLKTSFLSNMSHELRTPLNSVIALSGVLNRRLAKQIPDEEYSYIEVIERNGKHLLSLINDILDISRIEAGREEIEIESFNINSLISEVVTMINPQVKQKNIELIHSEKDSDLLLSNDIRKCRHILQNLIGNAVKFTEKGKVEVVASKTDSNITIKVIDTGIGISEKYLPHIFDEFRQADGSTSRKYGGTGLGLAIAKKYANLMGGSITVKSSLGQGSEFALTLPSNYASGSRIVDIEKSSESKYTIKQAPLKTPSDSEGKTVLLVEDSEPAIIQMKDILEGSGYKLIIAHDGSEALRIINQTIPNAMILDLMLPGIDGFEVLKAIREVDITAHVPVLILTAKHISKEELQFLKRNNIHQLIQKGDVNRSELLNAIATMVFPKSVEVEKTQRKIQPIKGKPIVLAVEDNPDNMLTVKALLSSKYTVIEAFDGNQGLQLAKKHRPNLILMDIALPDMDGIEVLNILRKDPYLQEIPVIALTASAMTTDRETILAHGFDGYIVKPIDEHIFLETINQKLYGG